MADMDLTAPEGKIIQYRLENSIASPIVLGMLCLIMMLLVAQMMTVSKTWIVLFGTVPLGVGVFLYTWAKAIDKLKIAQKIIQNGARAWATGRQAPSGFRTAPVWKVACRNGREYRLVPRAEADPDNMVYIDGLRLYAQWVDGRVAIKKTPPPLLKEMRSMEATDSARQELSSGAEVPLIEVDGDRLLVRGGRDTLQALLADGVPAFPIEAADEFSAGRLQLWMGI